MLRESRGMHDRARTEAVDRLMSEAVAEIFFFLALWLSISRKFVGKVCIHHQRTASRGPPSRVVFCADVERKKRSHSVFTPSPRKVDESAPCLIVDVSADAVSQWRTAVS